MNCSEGYNGSANVRRFPRYEIDTEIDVTRLKAGKQWSIRGRSLNISEVGMAGLFVTGWDIGTSVNLHFSVPLANSPLTVYAVLRSRTDHRYGFEFLEMNPDQREIICKACRTLALLE